MGDKLTTEDQKAARYLPPTKSDAYWQRETNANGRKINDALDKHAQAKTGRGLIADASDDHFWAWKEHQMDKQDWRAEFAATGKLITPQQRDERAFSGKAPDHDPTNDYAEAYADVAGDPTLADRLNDENPIDIIDDARRDAREAVDRKWADPTYKETGENPWMVWREGYANAGGAASGDLVDRMTALESGRLPGTTPTQQPRSAAEAGWNPKTGTFQDAAIAFAIESPGVVAQEEFARDQQTERADGKIEAPEQRALALDRDDDGLEL
jgi:hypothetical protein